MSIDRWMDKEVMVHIHNGLLLTHKKECIWVSSNEVDEPAAAKSLQPCPTLCDPIDGSPPGSPVPGILQARTLEWVAISFSNAWKWKMKMKSLSRVWLLATPWTAAYEAPPSMEFSRQKYWSGVPLPSPLDTLYRQPILEIISYLVTAFTCSLIQIIDKGKKFSSERNFFFCFFTFVSMWDDGRSLNLLC